MRYLSVLYHVVKKNQHRQPSPKSPEIHGMVTLKNAVLFVTDTVEETDLTVNITKADLWRIDPQENLTIGWSKACGFVDVMDITIYILYNEYNYIYII